MAGTTRRGLIGGAIATAGVAGCQTPTQPAARGTRLVRFGAKGAEKPGLLDAAGRVRDLSGAIPDLSGANLSDASINRLRAIDPTSLPLAPMGARLGACVGGIGKFVAIGLNYRAHAAESNNAVPAEPVIFLKANSCIAGPYDDAPMPADSTKMDWEVELGVVIGSHAKRVSRDTALRYVAGYCVINDISERAFQLEGTGQWTKGKSCDGFGPIGPWLVPRDEVADPQALHLWLEVDGHRYQDANTADMIVGVADLVAYVSKFMSLYPGDVIATGTPSGTGLGQRPPVYLRPGQTMRLGLDGLGEQSQRVVAG